MEIASSGRDALPPQWREQVLIDLSRRASIAFGITGDEEDAFRWAAEDIEWIGPFSWQTLTGIDAIREEFVADRGEAALSLSDERWHARRVGSAWVVVGSGILAIDMPELEEPLQFSQRMMLVWARQPEGPRIACVHCSHAVDGGAALPSSTHNSEKLRLLREHFGPPRDHVGKLEFRDVSGSVHFLREEEVLCVLAEGPHCRVRIVWGEFVVRGSLQDMGERLSDAFVRTHRSCLANVGHVVRVDQAGLLMDDGSVCPLASRRRQAVRACVGALAR